MNLSKRFFIFFIAFTVSALPTVVLAQNKFVKKGKLVRIMRNRDGSVTEFSRNPANTVLEKRTYNEKANGEKVLRNRTLYRRDKWGNLRSGAIYDGQRVQLFRIVYGYEKGTGRLIAENMFDARVKRTNPEDPTQEQVLRALRYSYDAQGRRSQPMIFTGPRGATSEQLMDWLKKNKLDRGTLPETDPFSDTPVNPNARPAGQ